jgi:hypothetical protein
MSLMHSTSKTFKQFSHAYAVQCSVCPALMVPVASGESGPVCLQSPVKAGRMHCDSGMVQAASRSSCIVKEPGSNMTA